MESRCEGDGAVGSTSIPIKSSCKELASEKGAKLTGGNSKSTSELSGVSPSGLLGCSDDCLNPFSEGLSER
jgi:hypothetical protein